MNELPKKKAKKIGIVCAVPGLLIQLTGMVTADTIREPEVVFWADAAHLIGTIILLVGMGFYSKSKGRSALWALMAILSIVGVIVLAVIKDLTLQTKTEIDQ